MESECAMFKASVADTASSSCGLNVMDAASYSDNQKTCWWTPALMEAVKLKKECSPRELLKLLTVTGWSERLQLLWLQRQTSMHSRPCSRLCEVWVGNC